MATKLNYTACARCGAVPGVSKCTCLKRSMRSMKKSAGSRRQLKGSTSERTVSGLKLMRKQLRGCADSLKRMRLGISD